MLFLIYDTAKYGVPGLMALKKQCPIHDMLLSREYDGDLAFMAPWIFMVEEDQVAIILSLEEVVPQQLWLTSTVEMADIVSAFQKIIYDKQPATAAQFYRIWDAKVLEQALAQSDTKPLSDLYVVIENIYIPNGENLQLYWMDAWGNIKCKTVAGMLPKLDLCHNQLQE